MGTNLFWLGLRRFSQPGGSIRAFSFSKQQKPHHIVVSILGPPNAGKSTLFNRLLCKESNLAYRLNSDKGKRKGKSKGRIGSTQPKTKSKIRGGAIVSSTPGTTRDRREAIGRIGGVTFRLVDTAGIDERLGNSASVGDEMERKMLEQTLEAARKADLIFLMFDAKVGLTSDLIEAARALRKVAHRDGEQYRSKGITVLANKLEGDAWSYDGSMALDHLAEAARLGFGEAIPISAEHGEGMAELAVIIDALRKEKTKKHGLSDDDDEDKQTIPSTTVDVQPLRLAIVGRQNVGKSTLVNALLQRERVITGETPGLTRDAISIEWEWQGRKVQLVDTAGMRKSAQRDSSGGIEDLAILDALRTLKLADVVVVVLDALAGTLQRHELAIADAVVAEGRSIVFAANKMDLLVDADYSAEDFAAQVQEHVENRLPMLRNTPVVAISSLYGENVDQLMPVVFNTQERWSRVISTGMLNRWLREVVRSHPAPTVNGRVTRIKYITQVKGRPPTFLLFCNREALPASYLRFLTRNLQDSFDFYGMETRVSVKKSDNPYRKSKKRGGFGLGGRDARQQRNIKELKQKGSSKRKQ